MAASIQNPADAINAALVRIGWKNQIGNLRDGSAAANAGLAIYGQTRDEFMRAQDWDFAQRSVSMTLLKTAPSTYIPPSDWNPTLYPPLGWQFEYGYPEDCLKVRAVKKAPSFIPNFNPGPNVFSIANDNTYTPARRVILCNTENAILVYTGRVTDPTTWPPDFTEGFIELLGERLAPTLTGPQMAQLEAGEAAAETNKAAMEQG